MTVRKEIYADGVGQLHFVGNMVYFDFMTLQPAAEGEPPVPKSSFRVTMPPQGFLGAYNSMQQMIDRLVEAGVLQKTEPAAAPAPAAAAEPAKKKSSRKKK